MVRLHQVQHDDPAARQAFVALYQRVFSGPPYFETHTIAAVEAVWRRHLPHCIVFARLDGELVGFGCCLPLSVAPDPIRAILSRAPQVIPEDTVYMSELAVATTARGHGLGTRLLHARLTWAAAQGLTTYGMRTDAEASNSAGLYLRLGAVPTDLIEAVDGEAQSASVHRRYYVGAVAEALAKS